MFVCIDLCSHFAVCNVSITAVSHVCCNLLVRDIPTTSTHHSPCNKLLFGLYEVFLSNQVHRLKSSAAGPPAIWKKSEKGLWKVEKDSLQSNYIHASGKQCQLHQDSLSDSLLHKRITPTKFVTMTSLSCAHMQWESRLPSGSAIQWTILMVGEIPGYRLLAKLATVINVWAGLTPLSG